jgi:hypothetical protein
MQLLRSPVPSCPGGVATAHVSKPRVADAVCRPAVSSDSYKLFFDYSSALPQDLKAAEDAEHAAGEAAADPHALERKKLAEAEEWRLQQLRTGQATANANFQVHFEHHPAHCCLRMCAK